MAVLTRDPQPLTRALGFLEAEAWTATPFAAMGLVLPAADGRLRFELRTPIAASVNLMDPAQVPPALRLPATPGVHHARMSSELDPARAIDRTLALWGLDALCTTPVESDGQRGLLFAALAAPRVGPADAAAFHSLAERLQALAASPEPVAAYVARAARVDALSAILPALGTALDVREVFAQLSAILARVLPHDSAVVGLYGDDYSRMHLHALCTPPGVVLPDVVENPYPDGLNEGWVWVLHHDLQAHPVERARLARNGGFRSSMRVAIWVGGRVIGVLDVSADAPHAYTGDDIAVVAGLAEHVTLAMSHQRLADAARKAEALRERAANLEMLDGLLDAVSGVLDIREVFDRVSAIARVALPHDAMAIAITLDHPPRLRVHALSGFAGMPEAFETPMPEPHLLTDPWEYRILDYESEPAYAESPTAKAGMKSVLCLPIRLQGRLHAGLNFYARRARAFSPDDVIVARRITDHIALAVSHQRLVEEAQQAEELRAATEYMDILDELLATSIKDGPLEDVLDRVSLVSRGVLAHDAMALPAHHRWHGGSEYDLVDDLSLHPDRPWLDPDGRGYRSALRVPVRIEGRDPTALVLLSQKPAAYKPSDVLLAHRIADRLALAMASDGRAEAASRADEATSRAAALESRVRALTDELDARTGFRRVVGESPVWREVLGQATQVAATDATVLLRGESGTGKEIVARFVHRASKRREGPFVALNCAALPEHLLEAELFGYERGAFTGAHQSKPGLIEQAAGGTLFLDEVGEMAAPAQAKFLRVLQEREFQRLGGTRVLRSDARIIAATNRDLEQAIAQSRFREDLYYRLNVFAIRLPLLRERRDDIRLLADAFLAEVSRGLGRPPAGIAEDAHRALAAYHWPGNVRELRNILERAAILCDGGLITADHLSLHGDPGATTGTQRAAAVVSGFSRTTSAAPPAGDLPSMERAAIERALADARFNKSKAAKALGVTRAQLYVRMRKYGLE